MDFLGTCVWIWEFLVLFMLPLISILLAAIYIPAISKALNISLKRYFTKSFRKMNDMLRGR